MRVYDVTEVEEVFFVVPLQLCLCLLTEWVNAVWTKLQRHFEYDESLNHT